MCSNSVLTVLQLFDPPQKNHPYNEGCVGKERGWGVFEGAESIFLGGLPKN